MLILPVSLFAQQAKTAIGHLNQILNNDDLIVNFSIRTPNYQGKSFNLNYLKSLELSNNSNIASIIKTQEPLTLGEVVSAEGQEESNNFEIFMAQHYYKGPLFFNIGEEKFLVEANLEDGIISSVEYINPKNNNILRFIYHGETKQLLQFIFQLEGNYENTKNENVVYYFNSMKESGGKDRGINLVNNEEVSKIAKEYYLIIEQLVLQYKACEIEYGNISWQWESVLIQTESLLNSFNKSNAKDNYGNLYNSYFTGEKEVKIYTKIIVSPAHEKSVLFEFYNMPFLGTQFNQNKIKDGLRKIILDNMIYNKGYKACLPSGIECRILFIFFDGKLKEVKY